jgi:hypothetical protein
MWRDCQRKNEPAGSLLAYLRGGGWSWCSAALPDPPGDAAAELLVERATAARQGTSWLDALTAPPKATLDPADRMSKPAPERRQPGQYQGTYR